MCVTVELGASVAWESTFLNCVLSTGPQSVVSQATCSPSTMSAAMTMTPLPDTIDGGHVGKRKRCVVVPTNN